MANLAVHRLRFLLRLVREYGDAYSMSRVVQQARVAVYDEASATYRPGITETMLALDAALAGVEVTAPIERTRAAYQAVLATAYATSGRVSPALATAMARVEYAAVAREFIGNAAFDALDEIDGIITSLEDSWTRESGEAGEAGEADEADEADGADEADEADGAGEADEAGEAGEAAQAGEEESESDEVIGDGTARFECLVCASLGGTYGSTVEAVEAGEADRREEVEADRREEVEADRREEGEADRREAETQTVPMVPKDVEAVSGSAGPAAAENEPAPNVSNAGEPDGSVRNEKERNEHEEPFAYGTQSHRKQRKLDREIKETKEAMRKLERALERAERERDEALITSSRCNRCERISETVLRFWISDGGMLTDERLKPLDEEKQKWSVYVEKMRGVIEHMRSEVASKE